MIARAERVHGPQDDVSGVNQALGIHARRAAYSEMGSDVTADAAERLLRDSRAEPVEERVADSQSVHDTFLAEVAAGHDSRGPEFVDNSGPPALDLGECLRPTDPLEFAGTLRPHSPHRIEDTIWIVVMRREVVQFGA